MITNRTALLVCRVISKDKKQSQLAKVHIRADGTTIALNGRAVLAVEGVSKERQEKVPFEGSGTDLNRAVTLPLDLVEKILKGIPIDKQFDGQLELLHINKGKKEGDLIITTHDGKGEKRLKGTSSNRKYVDYKGIIDMLYFKKKIVARVILDRRRVMDLLAAMDKICGDAPTYCEITENNDMFLRSFSADTEQRVVAASAGVATDWEEPGDFTDSLRITRKVRRKKVKRKAPSLKKKTRLKKK